MSFYNQQRLKTTGCDCGHTRMGTGAALARALVTGTVVTSLSLSPVLGGLQSAWAEEVAESTQTDGVTKDETVYVKAKSTGKVSGIYVVNQFDSDSDAEIEDAAAYTKVVNLTDGQNLIQEDGKVKVQLSGGKTFYYQGNLSKSTELPWNISVTYRLDGKEISAKQLAGATGDLEIDLSIDAKTDADSGVSDFANSCVVQAQGAFDNDTFTVTDAGDATEAHVGNSTTLTALVLPGESETFSIKGEAKDFEYDGWQIAAMPLSMAVDISDQASELTDQTSELSNATQQLASGSNELSDAMGTASSGASSVAAGASSVAQGVTSLADALGQVSAQSQALRDGSSGVASGASQLVSGLSQYQNTLLASKADSAMSVSEAQNNYAAAMNALVASCMDGTFSQDKVDAVNQSVNVLAQASGQSGANQALDQAASGLDDVISGASSLEQGANSLDSGVGSYTEGVDAISASAGKTKEGTESLASGSAQVAAGAADLASGIAQAKDGVETLSDASQELADATAGLGDKVIDEVQSKIDEKLGADFKTHGFTVTDNDDVDCVQFVYVVDGVSKTAEKNESKDSVEDKTVLDRFLDLFKSE